MEGAHGRERFICVLCPGFALEMGIIKTTGLYRVVGNSILGSIPKGTCSMVEWSSSIFLGKAKSRLSLDSRTVEGGHFTCLANCLIRQGRLIVLSQFYRQKMQSSYTPPRYLVFQHGP